MRNDFELPPGADPRVTRALRELYAPPEDERYWEGMEGRIMARVAAGGEWWGDVLVSWLPVGVAAAILAIVVAGAALMQSRAAEARIAYEAVMSTSSPLAVQAASTPEWSSPREATLRYVIMDQRE